MQTDLIAISTARVSIRSETLGILSSIALGMIIIVAVGFAGSDILHAAAHDTRHAMAFPCH